jgi:hypothetical protein
MADASDGSPDRGWLVDRSRVVQATVVVLALLLYGYVVQGDYRTVGAVVTLFVVGIPSAYVGFTVVEYAIRTLDG